MEIKNMTNATLDERQAECIHAAARILEQGLGKGTYIAYVNASKENPNHIGGVHFYFHKSYLKQPSTGKAIPPQGSSNSYAKKRWSNTDDAWELDLGWKQ